jgi:hypothetical protein
MKKKKIHNIDTWLKRQHCRIHFRRFENDWWALLRLDEARTGDLSIFSFRCQMFLSNRGRPKSKALLEFALAWVQGYVMFFFTAVVRWQQ